MGELLVYVMKSAVCLIAFLLFYKIILSNETFHRFNRFALLGIILISIVIPGIKTGGTGVAGVYDASVLAVDIGVFAEEAVPALSMVDADDAGMNRGLVMAGCFVYMAGVLFFFIKNVFSFVKILRITNNGKREDISRYVTGDTHRYKLTVTDSDIPPFSWMNHIVISRKDLEENGAEILEHEMAHVKNRHSWDLLVADAYILVQWFNPAAWILKMELQNVHEFEADEAVISNGIDAKNYQLLLIKKAVGARLYSIANSFNHSKLKKRITMMMKKKSNPWARAKYVYVLPLAAVAVAAFARPEVSELSNEISSVKVSDFPAITENHNQENISSVPQAIVTVEGKVIDDSGKPIMGVSVIERGSTNGTLTDEKGKFTLKATENSVIVLSFIGKQTYSFVASQLEVKELKNTPITMKDDVQNVDEIVVVAYEPEEKAKEEEKPAQSTGQDDVVFVVVEEMPEFPGGMAEFMKYVARNIKYPTVAQEAKIEGRVIVQFVVGTDGYTSDYKVMRSVCPALDAEAIRVLAQMPKWKPGKQRGVAVPVKYTVPVTFRLQKKEAAGSETPQIR